MVLPPPPRVEDRLATEAEVLGPGVDTPSEESRRGAGAVSRTPASVQAVTPTMMLPPSTAPLRDIALLACILVCILTCIQLELGWMMCCSTVPHTDSSERMKLTAEGGKPQTVTQVSRGEGAGEEATSWLLMSPAAEGAEGGDRRLVPKLPLPGVDTDLLGVKRRECVGGPPAAVLSPRAERDSEEFRFSFSSCGPRMLGSCGVCGAEPAAFTDTDLFSLLGDIKGRWCKEPPGVGVEGLCMTGSPIRKPGRYPDCPGCGCGVCCCCC